MIMMMEIFVFTVYTSIASEETAVVVLEEGVVEKYVNPQGNSVLITFAKYKNFFHTIICIQDDDYDDDNNDHNDDHYGKDDNDYIDDDDDDENYDDKVYNVDDDTDIMYHIECHILHNIK